MYKLNFVSKFRFSLICSVFFLKWYIPKTIDKVEYNQFKYYVSFMIDIKIIANPCLA